MDVDNDGVDEEPTPSRQRRRHAPQDIDSEDSDIEVVSVVLASGRRQDSSEEEEEEDSDDEVMMHLVKRE